MLSSQIGVEKIHENKKIAFWFLHVLHFDWRDTIWGKIFFSPSPFGKDEFPWVCFGKLLWLRKRWWLREGHGDPGIWRVENVLRVSFGNERRGRESRFMIHEGVEIQSMTLLENYGRDEENSLSLLYKLSKCRKAVNSVTFISFLYAGDE